MVKTRYEAGALENQDLVSIRLQVVQQLMRTVRVILSTYHHTKYVSHHM